MGLAPHTAILLQDDDAAMVEPAWARGLRGAASSALAPEREPDLDPVVILVRALEEAYVGVAAWVVGGGALHSAVCTFPLLALGVGALSCLGVEPNTPQTLLPSCAMLLIVSKPCALAMNSARGDRRRDPALRCRDRRQGGER